MCCCGNIDASFTLVTAARPSAVFDFLRDLNNAAQWDPGTQSTRPRGGGVDARRGGQVELRTTRWPDMPLYYAVDQERTPAAYVSPVSTVFIHSISADGVAGRAPTVMTDETLIVADHPAGCRVTYRLRLRLSGARGACHIRAFSWVAVQLDCISAKRFMKARLDRLSKEAQPDERRQLLL